MNFRSLFTLPVFFRSTDGARASMLSVSPVCSPSLLSTTPVRGCTAICLFFCLVRTVYSFELRQIRLPVTLTLSLCVERDFYFYGVNRGIVEGSGSMVSL